MNSTYRTDEHRRRRILLLRYYSFDYSCY